MIGQDVDKNCGDDSVPVWDCFGFEKLQGFSGLIRIKQLIFQTIFLVFSKSCWKLNGLFVFLSVGLLKIIIKDNFS